MSGEVPWAHCDEYCLEGVGRLVGAKKEEVSVCNSLTVNIHVLLVNVKTIGVNANLTNSDFLLQTHGDSS